MIIQTAFIGDVILATALVEKLAASFPGSSIDFLCRKGNESLLQGNPHIREVIIFDKRRRKYRNLIAVIRQVRSHRYDLLINVQRFMTTALISVLSGAGKTIGFNKSPLSFLFTNSVLHKIGEKVHEVDRNQELIRRLTDDVPAKPRLYPSNGDREMVRSFTAERFVTISPASVWFTKQFPVNKWVEAIRLLPEYLNIYLLGSGPDRTKCEEIRLALPDRYINNLAGELSLLQSAALMEKAEMNYVNDSAPMHLASAMNAPVTAVYCSTVPEFGFGPLSDHSRVVQTDKELKCRPCGLHGRPVCPEGHFECALSIRPEAITSSSDH